MRKLRDAIRLVGIIFILLPLFTSTIKYDVSSSEDILLSETRVQEIEHVENTESASDLNITGITGALTQMEIPVVKRAYITIDDGPSPNTDRILDILNMYGVKATFFVNNKEGAENMLRYQRIVNEGHTIGLHSATHVYKSVYKDDQSFLADLQSNQSYIASITGVVPVIYRFPGGSNNTVSPHGTDSFINILNNLGIAY